jgi:hypothetical protein
LVCAMIVILLRWHKAISWKLGEGDAAEGRPYRCPWWVNEAHYALAYTRGKLIEASPVSPRFPGEEVQAVLKR